MLEVSSESTPSSASSGRGHRRNKSFHSVRPGARNSENGVEWFLKRKEEGFLEIHLKILSRQTVQELPPGSLATFSDQDQVLSIQRGNPEELKRLGCYRQVMVLRHAEALRLFKKT